MSVRDKHNGQSRLGRFLGLSSRRRDDAAGTSSSAELYGFEMAEVGDSKAAKATIGLCGLLVVFFLVWASLVQVEEKVSGTGVIELQGNIERIEHPDGGIVEALATRVDAVLSPDSLILQFDTSQIEREALSLAARINTLEGELLRVRFLMQSENSAPASARIEGDAASEAFWNEQEFLAAQLRVMEAEERRLVTQIESLQNRTSLLLEEQNILLEQLRRYTRAAESGIVRLTDKESLEREAIQIKGLLAETRGRATDLEVAQEQIKRRKAELLAQSRRDAAVRLTKVEEELVSLKAAAADAADRIERATVKTRTGGRVQRLEVLQPNEIVAPGDVIAEIVPSYTAFRAIVNVSADQIGEIKPGLDVSLKVISYDFTRFGDIRAKITQVSPTSFTDEQGEIVYRVTIDLPDSTAVASGQVEIRPGLTVTADILIGERSILSYLLSPVRRVQDQALTEA